VSEENKTVVLTSTDALNARDLNLWSQKRADDFVLIHWTASGTHTERLATISGETVPPTGRRVTITGVPLAEVRDGKVVRSL
jgi:SnoaL-like polyketide cyclase